MTSALCLSHFAVKVKSGSKRYTPLTLRADNEGINHALGAVHEIAKLSSAGRLRCEPTCASQMGKSVGLAQLMPTSKPKSQPPCAR